MHVNSLGKRDNKRQRGLDLTVKTDQSVERGKKTTSSDLGFAEALAGVGPEKRGWRRTTNPHRILRSLEPLGTLSPTSGLLEFHPRK